MANGAVRGVHSHMAGASYHFDDVPGLRDTSKAEFWAHMAVFPVNHSGNIPQYIESKLC